MSWCFAIINGRLAEVFLIKGHKKTHIVGHAYIKESEYTSRKEKLMIKMDTAKYQFSYRKGKYKLKNTQLD